MSDNIVFKSGAMYNVDSTPIVPGQILFAYDENNKIGSIYYDKTSELRIQMSPDDILNKSEVMSIEEIDAICGQLTGLNE